MHGTCYHIADHFDCPALIERAAGVIKRATGSKFLEDRHKAKDVLEWWHMAQRFGLSQFAMRCVTHVAGRCKELQHDPRLLQMPQQALLQLLAEVHGILKRRHVQFSFTVTGGTVVPYTIPSKEYSAYFYSAVRCPGHHSTIIPLASCIMLP